MKTKMKKTAKIISNILWEIGYVILLRRPSKKASFIKNWGVPNSS
jgi:hypothetical protein